jgi:uncharacterized YigZ family protein
VRWTRLVRFHSIIEGSGNLSIRTRTIAHGGNAETVVKKSHFICSLGRVSNEDEARAFIAHCKKQYWDANHNCSAWVIGERGDFQRSHDDGEPSGTAGAPILNVLNQQELTDVIAVVTRYFGGTLLGSGGLIRAYGHVVSEAIDAVGLVERKSLQILAVRADHQDAGRIDNALRASDFNLTNVEYGSDVTFTVHVEEAEQPDFENWLSETSAGKSNAEFQGIKVVEVPLIQH